MNPQANPQAAQNYLKTKVFTATPEQLQLMLYDGAIRFGEQARVEVELFTGPLPPIRVHHPPTIVSRAPADVA